MGEQGDPTEKVRHFRDQHHLTYPILLDRGNRAAEALGVIGYPTNVILDREGTIRYLEPGYNAPAIDRVLHELMAK
jgi:peroxiredoxin